MPPEPGQHQGQSAYGVAHQRPGQRRQAQSGKQHHESDVHVPGVVEHVNEAPGARELIGVRAQAQAGQEGHAQGHQPDGRQADLGPRLGDEGRVQQRLGDAQAALGGHGAAQEERAQAKEHHASSQELAHDVGRVEVFGIDALVAVEAENQDAGNQVAHEIRDHQGRGEEEERGLGAPALALVRGDQDAKGHDVGDDAQRHGDGGDAHPAGLRRAVRRVRRPPDVHAGPPLCSAVGREVRGAPAGRGVVVTQSKHH